MNKQYVGVDPGKTGQIVVLDSDGEITKYAFPQIGTEYDIHGILKIFESFPKKSTHIVIEDVKALQKPFDSGNWSLSQCKAIVETACIANGLPYTLVHSKTWQKEIWQGVKIQQEATGKKTSTGKPRYKTLTKETTLIAINRLFPGVDLREYQEPKYYADTAENRKLGRANKEIPRKSSKPHDGVVDALAMAEYCRRHF